MRVGEGWALRSVRPSDEGSDRGRGSSEVPDRSYAVPAPGESIEDYERAIAAAEDALELDLWRALLLEALDEDETGGHVDDDEAR